MDISVGANPKQMPAYLVSNTHIQTFQVTKHTTIDGVHLVTFHEAGVCLLLHGFIRVSAKSLYVLIKKPALVLVHHSE